MRWKAKTAAVTLALAQAGFALDATILADSNRDGLVDAEGDSHDKQTWSQDRGALFLANIGDTDQRCSSSITSNTTNAQLDQCNDATGNKQRNPQYLAPLITLPNSDLTSHAVGSIHVTDSAAASKVRVFLREAGEWTFVSPEHTFNSAQLSQGLELGIDSRDVRRPEWDGRVTVHFTIHDGGEQAHDSVALRVAPVLSHHHGQPAEHVFTTKVQGWLDQGPYGYNQNFVSALENATNEAGLEFAAYPFGEWDVEDQWTQDFVEPGYTSIPGPNGEPIVLRVLIRSAQPDRTAGRDVFRFLRSETVGVVQYLPSNSYASIDSTGNLETIPPHTNPEDGRAYPAGRIIMGARDNLQAQPRIIPFLRAQETQDPLILDTSWLTVGHVDEFIQFLPVAAAAGISSSSSSSSERGWVMTVADPEAGLALLQKASEDGHGDRPLYSRPHFDYDHDLCPGNTTIDEQLALGFFAEHNRYAARRIEANIDIVKNATGLTEDEIIRVPATYWSGYQDWYECPAGTTVAAAAAAGTTSQHQKKKNKLNPPTPGRLQQHKKGLNQIEAIGGPSSLLESSSSSFSTTTFSAAAAAAASAQGRGSKEKAKNAVETLTAQFPGTINGVVLSGSSYLAPNPWGPVLEDGGGGGGGEDIMAEATRRAYAKAGFDVTFMDDWYDHHLLDGEVHCGSNVLRSVSAEAGSGVAWWG